MAQLPDYFKGLPQTNRLQETLATLGGGRFPEVSRQNNVFSLIDLTGESIYVGRSIRVVIIDINPHRSKLYYDKPFGSGEAGPPVCFSDNGKAPSTRARQPQSVLCDTCEHNKWVEGVGRACGDYCKIAVYVVGPIQTQKGPYEPDGLYLLRIPPASLKNFKNYLLKFEKADMQYQTVFTDIKFIESSDPKMNGRLAFSAPGAVQGDLAPHIIELVLSKEAEPMIGLLDQPWQGQLEAPKQIGPFAPSAANPPSSSAPEVSSVPDAQPTPKKRGPRKQAESAAEPTQAPFRQSAGQSTQFGINNTAPTPPEGLQEQLNSVFGSKS